LHFARQEASQVSLVRSFTKRIHSLDHQISRLSRRRRVLVEMRTPVYHSVLFPICEAIREQIPHASLHYTSEYPDRIRGLVAPGQFISHAEAEWTRFDLYLNADPWAAVRLRRCARRVNFFHGVAGKYDLDRPVGLPMDLGQYDRIAFINRDRMDRYRDAGLVTETQAVLVGYPKLDRLVSRAIDAGAVRASLGFDGSRPMALYAPTYSPASSLHLAGEAIIAALESAGFDVIVKLHDRSLDSDPRYTAGIDWRRRLRPLEQPGRIRHVETADVSPLLAIADLMVTDHSSVGFEYLVLDRPLIVFNAPGLTEAARINPEKVALLRSAATVVQTVEDLGAAARHSRDVPQRLSPERHRVADAMFFKPGTATDRALMLVRQMLDAGGQECPLRSSSNETVGEEIAS
jgi:hypothetical protein